MNKPVIILGSGGHAKVLVESILQLDREIVGICTSESNKNEDSFMGFPVLGNDSVLKAYNPEDILLVNGVGSTGHPIVRYELFDRMKAEGFSFYSVMHPKAIISRSVCLEEGCQVMAGVVIQAGARVGRNVILNTSSSVDHDCIIGDHSHIAPGVTLSGSVNIGERVHIGTGANVIQGVSIGDSVVVGAGVTVLKDVPEGIVVKAHEHNIWV